MATFTMGPRGTAWIYSILLKAFFKGFLSVFKAGNPILFVKALFKGFLSFFKAGNPILLKAFIKGFPILVQGLV